MASGVVLGAVLWVSTLVFASLLSAQAATVNGCTCLASSPCLSSGESYNWCYTEGSCGTYSWVHFAYWDKCNAQCEAGCPMGSRCGDATKLDASFKPADSRDPPNLACICDAGHDCVPSTYCDTTPAATRVIMLQGATCHTKGTAECCAGTYRSFSLSACPPSLPHRGLTHVHVRLPGSAVCSTGSWGTTMGSGSNMKCCSDSSISIVGGECACGTTQTCSACTFLPLSLAAKHWSGDEGCNAVVQRARATTGCLPRGAHAA